MHVAADINQRLATQFFDMADLAHDVASLARQSQMFGPRTHLAGSVTKGSGNPEMDAIPCNVAKDCIAEGIPDRRLLGTCVEDRSRVMLDALADRWRSAWSAGL